MQNDCNVNSARAADGFDRPLLLTVAQDMRGYILGHLGKKLLFVLAASSILMVLLILAFIGMQSWQFFTSPHAGDMFTSKDWSPTHSSHPVYGCLAMIYGSLTVTVISTLLAVPIGVMTAVFLSDIVPFSVRQIAKPVVETLAAIPSVAYGFFAVIVFAPYLQNTLGLPTGVNTLNASLLLAMMSIPTIVSVSEDSLTAIGREYREASYALGATRAETILTVIIPAAKSGIMAAVVLGMMRAIGETMVVWMASGSATQIPTPWWDLTASIRAITGSIAGEMGEAAEGSLHRSALFAQGMLLLVFTFAMNMLTEHFLASSKKIKSMKLPSKDRNIILTLAGHLREGAAMLVLTIGKIITLPFRLIGFLLSRLGDNLRIRMVGNRGFTATAWLAMAIVIASLGVVLFPILKGGSSAVVFKGTSEWRRLQFEQFGRGDAAVIKSESAAAATAQQPLWDIVDSFTLATASVDWESKARSLKREFKTQIENRMYAGQMTKAQMKELDELAENVRDLFVSAVSVKQQERIIAKLNEVDAHRASEKFSGTVFLRIFDLADEFRKSVDPEQLALRDQYRKEMKDVNATLRELFGPRPGENVKNFPMREIYGATRWDRVEILKKRLLYKEVWVKTGGSDSLVKTEIPREKIFAGTQAAAIFPMIENDLDRMLNPKISFYPNYFTDTSLDGMYFGGIGDEIWGTLLITLFAILFALPLGVITAGYLVECAGDNIIVRIIRTCINTLAGVPSIVFGLFGLAFFVTQIFSGRACILTASATLAILILPIIIRSSEEAIRAVPHSYKEASNGLGAGKFRCFVGVTMPAAMPGILTGVILGMSRAAGETAPILFTGAIAYGAFADSLLAPTKTLSYGAYCLAVGDQTGALVPHNRYGMVATLVVLVLVLNMAAFLIRGRIAKKLRGH